jgi:hypothetical protein
MNKNRTALACFSLTFFLFARIALAVVDLPPDPGSQGEKTLEGIDSNQNGVRDDVERYIGLHYPDSAKTRAALMQYAQAMQENLLNQKPSLDPVHKIFRAQNCLVYIVGISSWSKMMTPMEAVILNTESRLTAYYKQPPGTPTTDFYKAPQASERKAECSFDPDALPN